jgi:L-ascorbate metabolism protein UlaG (beta-lactamase superfamily)
MEDRKAMKIKWFNVSAFMITTEKGVKIITDPFAYNYKPQLLPLPPNFEKNRPPIGEYADVVTLSHGHFDHSYVGAGNIKGIFKLYTGGAPKEYKGVKFSGVTAYHDPVSYNHHGFITLNVIDADGIRIMHTGDYGQKRLYDEQVTQLGRIDILMTAWGEWVPALIEQLKPKVVLPMHHARVDDYMRSFKGFTDFTGKTSELEFTKATLPAEMQVIMLKQSMETNL